MLILGNPETVPLLLVAHDRIQGTGNVVEVVRMWCGFAAGSADERRVVGEF